jgi:SAM-dependent methyltransferase
VVERTAVPTGNTYDKYGTTNPVERRMMAGFLAALDDLASGSAAQRVLEVGAGEGRVAERIRSLHPEAALVVLDLPDSELAADWSRRALLGAQGSVDHLPFPDRSMDLVLAIEVLEHVPDPDRALAEIARVARRDVVLSVPREPWWRIGNMARGRYLRDLGNTPGHVQHWGRRGFVGQVARHLDVVDVRTPPPWTMVRARRR